MRTGRIASIYGEFQSGSDGTRTRDLRRDSATINAAKALQLTAFPPHGHRQVTVLSGTGQLGHRAH
jgi:hypothetical protein